MAIITRIERINSIKAGSNSQVLEDGTILSPDPYHAADIYFDDGIVVQVERPLNDAKVAAAHQAEVLRRAATVDGVSTGNGVP